MVRLYVRVRGVRYHLQSSWSSSSTLHLPSEGARNSFPEPQAHSWYTFFLIFLAGLSAILASFKLLIMMLGASILICTIKARNQ